MLGLDEAAVKEAVVVAGGQKRRVDGVGEIELHERVALLLHDLGAIAAQRDGDLGGGRVVGTVPPVISPLELGQAYLDPRKGTISIG